VQILYAVAALGGVALIFGAMLALAARFFAVESDPRVEAVRDALPGVNCGACGYAGCTSFAEAVVEGKAASNGCIPGGQDSSTGIAAILGQDAAESTPLVATVFCAGDRENSRDLFVYHGIKDCVHAQKYGGGFKACAEGCLGLGTCVSACPFEAIRMGPSGLPLVDWQRCGGCGLCASACPRAIIRTLPKESLGHLVLCNSHQRGKTVQAQCDVGCNACNACVRACPRDAITLEDNLAVIDLAKCDDCGKCAEKCRPGAIHPRAAVACLSARPKAAAVAGL
jgi:Na+-translocating ferredoxin:NAD+ oxidoreductase subunit B